MNSEQQVETLRISMLSPYPGHIFAPYKGERLDGMVASVKERGVISPIIVRKIGENEYQILSGHNRVNAAKAAELTEIKAIVHEGLSNDEAEFIVTETNLMQRSFADLKHSERARAIKNHLEALQKLEGGQGKRSDLVTLYEDSTLFHGETKLDTLKKTGEQYALSKTTAFRYLRLAKLPVELIEMVDIGRVAILSAVEISFLSDDEMKLLAAVLKERPRFRVTPKAGERLRTEVGRLTKEMIIEILAEKKAESDEGKKIKRVSMSNSVLSRLGEHTNDISGAVEKVLNFYFGGLDSGEFDNILSETDEERK